MPLKAKLPRVEELHSYHSNILEDWMWVGVFLKIELRCLISSSVGFILSLGSKICITFCHYSFNECKTLVLRFV